MFWARTCVLQHLFLQSICLRMGERLVFNECYALTLTSLLRSSWDSDLVCKAFERGFHNDVPVEPTLQWNWLVLCTILQGSQPFGGVGYRWRLKSHPLCMAFLFLKSTVVSLAKLRHFCLWPSNENCWMNWDEFIWSDFFLPCGFKLSAVCWKLT